MLVEQLHTNPDLTGPDAMAALEAAGFGPVAARTARRLLSKARDVLIPASSDAVTDPTNDLSPDPVAAPAAADDTAGGAVGGADGDDVPGVRPSTPWAPTGTDAGRPLALVRPAAATPTGDR
ncbi:hypothetical protein [Actinomycetospora soli]|uniref:hypothetical protein n=1 Tax=Actinomycetospora soli TaxID=2893887 RepID=UPI001E563ADD|nr:hypothetical protein [Actinomycetospora soli]MCD2191220.1 hypothetical protein [Actinomycetospora soli]